MSYILITLLGFELQHIGPSELVGSADECSFVEVNNQHFYTNFTLQSLGSGNYQVITKIKNGNELGPTQYESELSVTQDTDGDEIHDELEIMAGTSFNSTDTDGDFIVDPFGTAIYLEGEYAQYAEYTKLFFGTDPTEFDTDSDQLPDGYFNGYGELILGTDPLDNDTDGDGLDDRRERNIGTSLNNDDTDDDGLLDITEVNGYEMT